MSVRKRLASRSSLATETATDHGGEAPAVPSADADPIDLDAEALRVLSDEIDRDFGSELGRSALVLYDLDPLHLQAQWYVTPQEVVQAQGAFPGVPADLSQVLRLCRLGQDGRSQVVKTSRQGAGSAPCRGQKGFRLAGDGASYECELGLESANGGWLLLVRSNRIQMSAPAVSPQETSSTAGETSASHQSQILADEHQGVPVEAALAAVGRPLDPVFPNTGPLIDPPPWRRTMGAAEVADRKEATSQAAQTLPDRIPESTPEGNGVATAPVFWASDSMPPPLLPSDEEAGRQTGKMPGSLYDPRAALSSAALRGREPPGSDLDVWAELVVQGRGRPGARVELLGLPVRVEEDGHFSVRRTVDAKLLLSLALGRAAGTKPGDPDAE